MSEPEDFSLLRHRALLLFWLARVGSAIAYQMQAVAIGWQIYGLTSNPLDLGLVALMQFLPAALLTLVIGQIADRYDRRTIMRLAQTAEAGAAMLLALATVSDIVSRELIFTAALIVGTARAFESTANQSLLPAIVAPEHLPRAVAAVASAQQTATIAGPALGGFLYLVGPSFVYGLCAVVFLCASLCVALMRTKRDAPRREPLSPAVVFAGFRFIGHNPIVFGAISLDLFAVLLGGATALLPIFARDVFHVGPWGLGLLRAAPAIGALSMSLLLARVAMGGRVGRILYAGVAMYGIATIVFALSHSFVLSMLALTVVGASDMISVVIRQTLVMIETPDDMRGRVSAVNSLFVGTANQLGDFRAGTLAWLIGTIPSVLVGGIGTVLVVLAFVKLFPDLFQANGFRESIRKPV